MRKFSLFAVLMAISTLSFGCWPFGKKDSATARLGQPYGLAVPNPQGRIVEPGVIPEDRSFGPAMPHVARVYKLRNGDVIEVGVWGEDDMTKQVTVGPDGRISYYKAEVMAARKSLSALKEDLRKKLEKDFRKPEVFISLLNSAGNFVSVTGIVSKPGIYNINNETRLVDVIAKAGGIPLGSSRSGERFTEIADLDQSFVLRGDKFLQVNFAKLFGKKTGGARAIAINNVLLQPNDRIYIASAISLDNKVFVVGAVRTPSVIHFSKSITFLEALVTAGDVPVGAWERKSFIVRGRMNKPTIIPVNARDVRAGKIANIRLRAGDVIFMPKTPLAKITEVMRQMDMILSTVNTAERASNVKYFNRH